MERLIEKLKKYRILIIISVLLIAVLIIVGVLLLTNRKVVGNVETAEGPKKVGYYTDSDYPVYITENSETLLVELDGGKSPSLSWEMAVSDENKLKEKNDGETAKNGLVSEVIPLDTGYSSISYSRSGELFGSEYNVVTITIDLYAVQDQSGKFIVKVSDVSQSISEQGALDTDTPYFIKGSYIFFPNGGDWTLEVENQDKLPEGLYILYTDIDENGMMFWKVLKDQSYLFNEDGDINEDAANSVLILRSESLGIERRLSCVLDENREWQLVPSEENDGGE